MSNSAFKIESIIYIFIYIYIYIYPSSFNIVTDINYIFCSITMSNSSSLSCPSIKISVCLECESHMHPFLRCSKLSILSQKRIAEVLGFLELTQKYKSRKGKIDLSKKTQKFKFICYQIHGQYYHNTSKIKISEKDYKYLSLLLLMIGGDVEINPGPERMTLITQNCRGLKKDAKIRQLINRIYKSHSNCDYLLVALQETHLDVTNLKYQWRGPHIITAGLGNQGGCITLLSENIKVINKIDIGNEAHIALIEMVGNNESRQLIVTNLHAPCAHNGSKMEFFSKIREEIRNLQAGNDTEIIIMGDFNTVMSRGERINTIYSGPEKRITKYLWEMCEDLNLIDCWSKGDNSMTWRHGDKMSKIDRILFTNEIFNGSPKVYTDWTITESDHAAVIVELTKKVPTSNERVTRIDTRFMSNVLLKHKFLCELKIRLEQMVETNMNPHQKLEYLKVMIRSIALEIAAEEKKKSDVEQKNLKADIDFWQKAFENSKSESYKLLAITNLNDLFAKRDEHLNNRGEYLSNRNKTRWYQEGEKSTKYFLNLQRAKTKKAEMRELIINGVEVKDNAEINKHVEHFYKKLYEKGNSKVTNLHQFNDFVKLDPLHNDNIRSMETPITKDDLLRTLNTCSDSAPGPDGIPYSIIKATWNYFGDLLLDCWKYSQLTNELTHSHSTSYLRLIPKEGKDPKSLKNWRPITLSNCDFKLITKTLSKKLTEVIKDTISVSQTAYIPGRQITDNIHQMLNMIEESTKANTESMLVSLDAEKAFDSVEHWYIKEVLKKLGLLDFVKTFDLLYKNQMVNILLNGSKAGSYTIKNGVKQGDALSCILFILCIEPLIRNIQNDPKINAIKLNTKCSKIVAYADDVACMIKPDHDSLTRIFGHYEQLTNLSGLKLNADKTEIISNKPTNTYRVLYLNETHNVTASDSIKVNGLILSYNSDEMYKLNFGKLYTSMEKQLRSWVNRGLSLLGKILIYKTFGLSQILFVGAVIQFTKKDEAKITELIYRFIWNRDMDKKKAPDRIKRSTLHNSIENLGFGMIDFKDVLRSIKIKTVLRIINGPEHPLKELIEYNTNSSWIRIKTINDFRPPLSNAVKDIGDIWKTYLMQTTDFNDELLNIVANEYVGNLVEKRYLNKRICIKHRNDTIKEILTHSWNHVVRTKLSKEVKHLLDNWNGSRDFKVGRPEIGKKLPLGLQLINITKITSKILRQTIKSNSSNSNFKTIGLLNENQIKTLGNKIKKLTNVKLKGVILRLIHGDIYCAYRMKKFGMIEEDVCERCGLVETIDHMILTCEYTKKIWKIVSKITNIDHSTIGIIVGIDPTHDNTTMTINGEIVRQLLAIERPKLDPLQFVENTIKRLSIVEKGITKFQVVRLLNILKQLPSTR